MWIVRIGFYDCSPRPTIHARWNGGSVAEAAGAAEALKQERVTDRRNCRVALNLRPNGVSAMGKTFKSLENEQPVTQPFGHCMVRSQLARHGCTRELAGILEPKTA
jgi:hypothetical protein